MSQDTNGVRIVTGESTPPSPVDETLRELADRYRTLFDLAPIAIYSCDASGVVIEYNQRAADLWGRKPEPGDTDERFCGSFKLYRPDGSFMPHEQCPMGDVLGGKVPGIQNAEVHIERPDGSRIIVIVNIAPVTDDRGAILGAINCFYDVTERELAQEKLIRLAAIIESSDDAIISKNLNGIITSWNHGAERIFGYTAREIIGQPVTRLIPPDREDEEADILDRIRNGEKIEHFETVRRRKDGMRIDISLTISPLIDACGQIVGASKIARDITVRKRTEQRLRASEERYRNLYEAIDEGFCIIQVVIADNKAVDFIFLEVNPAFAKQTGIVNPQGRSVRAILMDLEDHWFEMYGQVALTGKPARFEYPAAELHRWFEGYAYRLGEAHERKVAVLFNDITARKRTEERLRQFSDELEKQVADRTAALTESQQRLRALATELTLMEQRERQRLAADLHDELGQLLALSRIQIGQATKQPMAPPLANLIAHLQEAMDKALKYTRTLVAQLSPPPLSRFGLPMALQWLIEQLQQQGLSVSLQVKGEILPLPESHALLVFQSIRELLHNCLKHSQTSEATILLQQMEDMVQIIVSDQGCGFHASTLNSEPHMAGAGFGLFSIRERMVSIGGRFDLASTPGKGTTSTMLVPVTDAPPLSAMTSRG